ncbi:MAG: hypothetical protein FWG10_05155 [Eubacteriaceae bacterium]|nr:hypothetical protein [Eubacteriaceae bacterium]
MKRHRRLSICLGEICWLVVDTQAVHAGNGDLSVLSNTVHIHTTTRH